MSARRPDPDLGRRAFLKVSLLASGALVVGVNWAGATEGGAPGVEPWTPNLYVKLNRDGTVTIVSKNPEACLLYTSDAADDDTIE